MRLMFSLTLVLAACSGPQDTTRLRDAVDASTISLAESAAIAEAAMTAGRAVSARLEPGTTAGFRVLAIGAAASARVEIDLDGAVRSSAPAAETDPCPGSISLAAAIAIAENEANGVAIAIQPDDDDACDREVQVLRTDDVLWEVKISGTGAVVESELSDESED